MEEKARLGIVACEVMKPELEKLRGMDNHVEIFYLEQSLHRVPQNMGVRLQAALDDSAGRVDRLVLGYGLCSKGILGVIAPPQGLIIPRCHDCISFFLGSPEAYKRDFDAHPGTYYLTPGWIEEQKDPLGIIAEYEGRYGRETAEWVVREELKHYARIVLIDTGIGDLDRLRARAMENALFLNLAYKEIEGKSLAFFSKILNGPYTDDEFIRLNAGETAVLDMFLT